MIISENNQPSCDLFEKLMADTDESLNADAKQREEYYRKRSGKLLETDVFDAIRKCAVGTPFDNSLRLVSGAAFPDIVVNRFYGVEVKSTEKNNWTLIGNSILESTRIADVKRIFLTFGKLGSPVRFISRPYEECMSGIAITHYPRYKIDMRLQSGETIFDKMGISYDRLQAMDDPAVPVLRYCKSLLKEGESVWWASENIREEAVAPTVRLWTALAPNEQERFAAMGFVLFPEIMSGSNKKYNKYSLWLVTKNGIVNSNIRDTFSASGHITIMAENGELKLPAAFGKMIRYRHAIAEILQQTDEEELKEYWGVDSINADRMAQWCDIIAQNAKDTIDYRTASNALDAIFGEKK